ncbi:MAG: hypothetical protein Q8938_05300 [Bacteroidota bacterium]|nr:hypothetical protein [Bacteroidota bacterium]
MTRYAYTSLLSILTMHAGLSSTAQTTNRDLLTGSFRQYHSQTYQEKLFVHVDRTFYLVGETIWFKVYDVDEYSNRPATLSAVSYVEVTGRDEKPWLQARIEMQDGRGSGSFQLPASFPSGNYLLRAYTSWMKNFSPSLYFSQQITVINTLTQPIPFAHPEPTLPTAKDKGEIQFFPEGGNLVAGLESKVAFKAVNSRGVGVSCQGIVVNQKRDTVARFHSFRFGMGNFQFTPVKGDRYEALAEMGDTTTVQKLPSIFEQGYVMSLTDPGGDKLRIIVHSNLAFVNPTVYLFVQTRHTVKGVLEGSISNGVADFMIEKSSLGDGITQFTLFNADRVPLCERLYFKAPAGQLRIEAGMAQTVFGTRKRIDLDLATTDLSGRPVKADLSLAVFHLDSLQTLPQENILSYLLLTGDLRGRIDSASYYFENSGPDIAAAVDNLMLTQGWTRFRWEDVLQNKIPAFTWLPEPDGHIITGKVIDKRTGLGASHVTGYLSVPGKHFEFSASVSKPNGDIRFHVRKFFGNSEIVVQTNSQTDSNYRIDITNPFSEEPSPMAIPDLQFPDRLKSALLTRSINAQVENTYRIALKHRLAVAEAEDTTAFYGQPDLHYNLDDYTRFVTLEEVIREYVLDVHLKEQSGKYDFRVRNSLFNTFFEEAPLVLLDGIPVFDAGKVVNMDPLRIRSLEVVTHRFYTNSTVADGILSYKTYDGDLAGYPLDPNAVAVQYSGLQQRREFYMPSYDHAEEVRSPIPDLRNLLIWDPAVRTDEQGKKRLSLTTSDLPGTYLVVLQGLTEDGLPGSVVRTFTVNR